MLRICNHHIMEIIWVQLTFPFVTWLSVFMYLRHAQIVLKFLHEEKWEENNMIRKNFCCICVCLYLCLCVRYTWLVFIPDSVIRNYFCPCSRNHIWCWGSKPGWLHARWVSALFSTLSLWPLEKRVKEQIQWGEVERT